jgi:hypothetical protein
MHRLHSLLRNLLRREAVERELDAELRATFEMLVAEKSRCGMSLEAARRAARLELGGIESVKDQVRVVRSGALVETWLQDVRYSASGSRSARRVERSSRSCPGKGCHS